jgi:hypothetical protein
MSSHILRHVILESMREKYKILYDVEMICRFYFWYNM